MGVAGVGAGEGDAAGVGAGVGLVREALGGFEQPASISADSRTSAVLRTIGPVVINAGRIRWFRVAGVAALAAPVLMWSEFLVMGTSRQGYDLLTRPFSDLATKGTQNATLFDLGFFLVPGVLTFIVGVGLWFALRDGQVSRAGALLIAGAGAFLFATGVFQQDPGSYVAGVLHGTMSQICFALASVAPLVLFIGSADHAHLAPPRRFWLAASLAALGIEASAWALHGVHYPLGFFQRPFTLVLTAWFVTTGVWLLRVRHNEGLSLAD